MHNKTAGAVRRPLLLFILVVVIGLGAGIGWQRAENPGVSVASAELLTTPLPLTPFALTDHNNEVFDRDRLKGQWTLLFFGYTHCPDVCPFTLAEMDRVHQRLAQTPNGLEQTQFVFVSVDPKRDDPAGLKEYVRYFNKSFIGATGATAQIDSLTQQMGVRYEYVTGYSPEDYLVNHPASVFLIDPEARWFATFKPPHRAEAISEGLRKIRAAAD